MGNSIAEVWKPIHGFEGHYEASNAGRIRSVKKPVPHLMKPRMARNGYMNVMICMAGIYRPHGVHRLVLLAFAGPAPEGFHACHHDGDKTNNSPENLRWDSPRGNALDMRRHGTHRNSRKTHCKRGHEFTTENTYIRPGGKRNCIACRATNWAEFSARVRSI